MKRYAIITDDAVEGIKQDINSIVSIFVLKHGYPGNVNGEKPISHSVSMVSKGLIHKTPTVYPPSRETISDLFEIVKDEYDEVFCILSADGLTQTFTLVNEISTLYKGRMKLHNIHSENISFGQGFLINKCVSLIRQNISPEKIEESLREAIPNIYTLLCTPDLYYPFSNGFIDAGQYLIGNQHLVQPLFSIENGFINPLDKTKNGRGVADFFIDFIQEFDHFREIAFLHPKNKLQDVFQEISLFSAEFFPHNIITQVKSNDYFSNLIGPNGFGLILIE